MDTDANRTPKDNAIGRAGEPTRMATGIEGLDEALGGGLPAGRVYVIEGDAGAGKTTLALQFLMAGHEHNEPCLLVTTTETGDELAEMAHSHGWSLAGLEILELSQADAFVQSEQQQTVFRPSQVELDETMGLVLAVLERMHPVRVVFDSVTTLRYMADEPFVYRRHIQTLKNALLSSGCTALITDELLAPQNLHLRTLAHGVVRLHREITPFGNQRRQMEIVKMRAMSFRSGRHDMRIATGGIRIFPRLLAESRDADFSGEYLSTGLMPLDRMLGGGLDRGTSTLITGTTGTGKSTIAMQCVAASLQRGQSAAVYLFDEQPYTWLYRSKQLGFNLSQQTANGNLSVQPIDPAEMSPSQFVHTLQQDVTRRGVQLITIDSLTGYINAMPDERFLSLYLRGMLTWLGQRGTTTLLVLNQHGLFESSTRPLLELSYLADTLILIRFFEHRGRIHRALSVVKRRSGPHENEIREISLDQNGVIVGEPLRQFRGVLTGLPLYEGDDLHGQP